MTVNILPVIAKQTMFAVQSVPCVPDIKTPAGAIVLRKKKNEVSISKTMKSIKGPTYGAIKGDGQSQFISGCHRCSWKDGNFRVGVGCSGDSR